MYETPWVYENKGTYDIEFRRKVLNNIVQNINYDYEKCMEWLTHFNDNFGYITMAQYIRIIESKSFTREEKDELLKIAILKMDFGCYENYFIESKNISELYQKIFMLITIEYIFDYISSHQEKKITNYIIWQVIAKYFVEEHQRLMPYDYCDMIDSNPYSSRRKIFDFFLNKNIDIQDKMNHHIKRNTFFGSIMDFYHSKISFSG
jgi:hypothetical protein